MSRVESLRVKRRLTMKRVPCPHCAGAGKVHDQALVGPALRAHREVSDITMRAMARALRYTPSYLSDLECGRRSWSRTLVDRYLDECARGTA